MCIRFGVYRCALWKSAMVSAGLLPVNGSINSDRGVLQSTTPLGLRLRVVAGRFPFISAYRRAGSGLPWDLLRVLPSPALYLYLSLSGWKLGGERMGCLVMVFAFGVLLVTGQLCLSVHGGRPGCSLQSIPPMASTDSGSRKLSNAFKEVFQRSMAPLGPQEAGGHDLLGWDMRVVPSGPDPLHHHNGGPRKPETP